MYTHSLSCQCVESATGWRHTAERKLCVSTRVLCMISVLVIRDSLALTLRYTSEAGTNAVSGYCPVSLQKKLKELQRCQDMATTKGNDITKKFKVVSNERCSTWTCCSFLTWIISHWSETKCFSFKTRFSVNVSYGFHLKKICHEHVGNAEHSDCVNYFIFVFLFFEVLLFPLKNKLPSSVRDDRLCLMVLMADHAGGADSAVPLESPILCEVLTALWTSSLTLPSSSHLYFVNLLCLVLGPLTMLDCSGKVAS